MRITPTSYDLYHFLLCLVSGLGICFLSPYELLAYEKVQEQAPSPGENQYGPRCVLFQVIRKSDGRPIPEATVIISWYHTKDRDRAFSVRQLDNPERLTDRQGRCRIDAPREVASLEIWVVKDGFAPSSQCVEWEGDMAFLHLTEQDWIRRDIRPGFAPVVTMAMEPGQPIGGCVKDDQGRPIRGAEVTVGFNAPVSNPDLDLLTPSTSGFIGDFPYLRLSTDVEGRWRCSSLPANVGRRTALVVRVAHPDFVSDSGFTRKLSLLTARAMTGVLPMRSGARISGLVRGGDGKPVPGARVVLAYSSGPDIVSTSTDAVGRFVFAHADEHPPLGRWIIEVEAAGLVPACKVSPPRSEPPLIEFNLTPSRPFGGRVIDRVGQPVAGIEVKARLAHLDHLSWRSRTDANGRFVWPDAPRAGDIFFDLCSAGGLSDHVDVSAKTDRADLTFDPE
jgi:hypothetical protein